MNAARLSRFVGILLLAATFAAIVVSAVRSEDPRRFAGYDATRSLTAPWPEAGLDFFTDGPRRALYVRQAGGRVFATPLLRRSAGEGTITALRFDPARRQLLLDGNGQALAYEVRLTRPGGTARLVRQASTTLVAEAEKP